MRDRSVTAGRAAPPPGPSTTGHAAEAPEAAEAPLVPEAGQVRQPDAAGIAAAVAVLAAGGVIGLPTETVYGLAADAGRREAVARIYAIKGRPTDHPLIVHVLDAAVAARWAVWNAAATKLAAAFWPGPVTLVLPRRATAPAWACAGEATIALRSPSHPVARAVMAAALEQGIEGIAAPSANRYGRVSPTRAGHVVDDLGSEVPLVLDGGDCAVGIESTIVDLSGDAARILRPGGLDAAAIAAVLDGVPGSAAAARPEVTASASSQAARTDAVPLPRVPGDRRSHYAPRTPVVVVEAERLDAELRNRLHHGERVAVWSVDRPAGLAAGAGGTSAGAGAAVWRQRPAEPVRFARVLYDGLRRLDREGCDVILIEQPPAEAVWAAVNDRLKRASAP